MGAQESIFAPAPLPPVRKAAKLRTYIVEDSPLIRDSLIETLTELVPLDVVGFAEDETTAVQWLRERGNDCQLAIVDIFLKQGSGLGLLRAMRKSAHAPKFVVLSNFATPQVRTWCRAIGADRVFDKSSDIDALIRYCAQLAKSGAEPGAH